MKKSNILIAAFAVMIASACAVKAQETGMDFDGKGAPKTMHDIFTNSQALVPTATLAPAELGVPPTYNSSAMDWSSVSQYIQTGNSNYCVPVTSGPWWMGCVVGAAPVTLSVSLEIPRRSFGEMSVEQKKQLAMSYILQADLKKAVIARAAEYNFSPEIAAFISDVKTKILYDNSKVFITNGRMLLVIRDEKLVAEAKQLRAAMPQYAANRLDYGGIGIILGCMTTSCWDEVGDAVSDATEWYVTHVQDHTGDPLLNTPD